MLAIISEIVAETGQAQHSGRRQRSGRKALCQLAERSIECGCRLTRQEGQTVICRNCGAAIYIPSIGQSGGCNPISVKSRVEGGEVIVDLSALGEAASKIHS